LRREEGTTCEQRDKAGLRERERTEREGEAVRSKREKESIHADSLEIERKDSSRD